MANKNKPTTRRRRSSGAAIASRLQTMQAAAGGVALFGTQVLARLPHGFESLSEGQGKKPTSNKRVLIILALLVWCITRSELKWKLWSIPLTALLTLAVQQHRLTYQSDDAVATDLTESYE